MNRTGVEIRDAATLVLLRDGAAGLEVLLLQRHGGHVFGANACVFPGGAVDDADADRALVSRCRTRFGPDELAAYRLAAIRESLEEAGVLVGCGGAGVSAGQLAAERAALNSARTSFKQLVERRGLYFDLDALVYVAQWVTPPGPPKRYATRFFAAVAPRDQAASADGVETVQAYWLRPADALSRERRTELELMYPTRKTLEQLQGYPDTARALAALAADNRSQA